MFITELNLYINYLKEEIENDAMPDSKKKKHYEVFCQNLLEGISYYQGLDMVAADEHAFGCSLYQATEQVKFILEAIRSAETGDSREKQKVPLT